MRNSEMKDFFETLAAVQEVYGSRLTEGATAIWWAALSRYELAQVREGFSRHVQNPDAGRFAPKPADIIRALTLSDGRPGAEEAWAMIPKREEESAVLTAEMRAAMQVSDALLEEGDHVAARKAFLEVYEREVKQARDANRPVEWKFSPGWDREGRETVLAEAVRLQRIELDKALPHVRFTARCDWLRAAGVQDHPLLAPPTAEQVAARERARGLLRQMMIAKEQQA